MTDELLKNIALATIGAATIILNFLEIYLIVKRWRKMKPYEQLLLNLAISDFFVGVIRLMLAIHEIHYPDWTNKPYSIVVWAFMQFSVSSSAVNIFAISTDRLIAIKLPLRHTVWMSKRNARIMHECFDVDFDVFDYFGLHTINFIQR